MPKKATTKEAVLKDGDVITAVVISSVTFGLGHILNLFTGHELGNAHAGWYLPLYQPSNGNSSKPSKRPLKYNA